MDKKLTIAEGDPWSWRTPFPDDMKVVHSRPTPPARPSIQPIVPEVAEEEPPTPKQPVLTPDQQKKVLKQLERIIHQGNHFATGEALAKIQDEKLYVPAGFRSFSQYCKHRFRMSRVHGHRLISQYHMNQFFVAHGLQVLPERQTRMLRGIPHEKALALVQEAQTTVIEGISTFKDNLKSTVKDYRKQSAQSSHRYSSSDGMFYCQTLRRKIQYDDYPSIPVMFAELSQGNLNCAVKLFSEFSELGGLGELDQEAIAKAVLVKHGETEIAEFGRAMGIALIEVSYEVDELGFKLW